MNPSNRDSSSSTVEGSSTGVDVTGVAVDDRVDGVGADGEEAEVTQLRDEVRTIMDNVVSQASISRYTNGIVNFYMDI